MFYSTDITEFVKAFDTKEKCLRYLSSLKWADGYCCSLCGHKGWSRTKDPFVRKCNHCKHKESATAGTLFHGCKISLPKAFLMVFLVGSSKKGISSYELNRKLSLRQGTCYNFKRKVVSAMENNEQIKLNGKIDVDEFNVGGPQAGKRGRSKGKKKEVVMAIELKKKGIYRCYARHINGAGTKQLEPFFSQYIDRKAIVRTDKWRGYRPLKRRYENLYQQKSKPGVTFNLFHRQVMMFKAWLRGIHHRVKYLQPYLDEFAYRFNERNDMNGIFNHLIIRMVKHQPVFVKNINLYWGN